MKNCAWRRFTISDDILHPQTLDSEEEQLTSRMEGTRLMFYLIWLAEAHDCEAVILVYAAVLLPTDMSFVETALGEIR